MFQFVKHLFDFVRGLLWIDGLKEGAIVFIDEIGKFRYNEHEGNRRMLSERSAHSTPLVTKDGLLVKTI